MKSMKCFKSITIILLVIFTVISCSLENGIIQKRRYQKGYYISIAKNKNDFQASSTKEMLIRNKIINNDLNEEIEQISQNKEEVQLEKKVLKEIKDSELSKTEKKSLHKQNRILNNKEIVNKLKPAREFSYNTRKNTSAKPLKKSSDSLINLILAIVLVVAIIMLLSFLDGLLGGLLSLILLIVIIALLLNYFGVV